MNDATRPALAAALCLLALPALAQDEIEFQTHEDWSLGAVAFTDQSIIAVSPLPQAPFELLATVTESLGPGTQVGAYARHLGAVYFSTNETILLPGGGIAQARDLVRWDGVTFAVVFKGANNGIPPGAGIDAVHVESAAPLRFSFSLDVPALLPGPGRVGGEDLARWNGASIDGALVFDGSARGVPSGANLTGFGVFSPARWQFSFDVPLVLGGARFDDGDVIDFNPGLGTWSAVPYLDAMALGYPDGLDMADFETFPTVPLLVTLESFTTDPTVVGEPVTIRWVTSLELDNAGFHVWRAGATPLQLGERLTASLVPGQGTDFDGASYSLVDEVPVQAPGDIRGYWLEDQELDGKSTFHGPVYTSLAREEPSAVGDWAVLE